MDFLTIAGFLVAALAIAAGLYLLLRKNAKKENSASVDDNNDDDEVLFTDDDLLDDAPNSIPVVPRHQRAQLSAQTTQASIPAASKTISPSTQQSAAKKPEFDDDEVLFSDDDDNIIFDDDDDILEQATPIKPLTSTYQPEIATTTTTNKTAENNELKSYESKTNEFESKDFENNDFETQEHLDLQQSQHLIDSSRPDLEPAEDAFDQALAQLEAATNASQSAQTDDDNDPNEHSDTTIYGLKHSAASATGLNRTVETADVEEWQGESALLNAHIEDQDRRDDESALAQAEQVVSLYVLPSAARPLTGERTMQLLRQFGLRYGEMALFHRFEDSDGTGPLMFSVLRYTSEGPSGFDLETLPAEQVEGLAFFLALPGKHAVAGFDTMISISTLLAREIGGQVYDDQMNQLTPQLREHYRHFVLDYRSPH